MLQYLLLVLTLYIISITSRDTCQLDNGIDGECMNIDNCLFAINQLKNKIRPKICDFNGTRPIVCCAEHFFRNIDDMGTNVFCALGYPKYKGVFAGFGGVNSLAMEFPHMAALGYLDGNETVWGCGGTLISKRHVLTAAHCIRSRSLGDVVYVRLGDLNLRSEEDDAFPQNFLVTKRIKHPDYRPPSQYHDIAIIELDKEVRITFYVDAACLNTDREINKTTLLATGWGQVGYGGDLADHLQKMTIKLVQNDECAKGYEKVTKRRLAGGIKDELQICAGAPNVDTCPGDSGGPLQINTYKGGVVYGVTSLGIACGISKTPGIYTRVSHYIDWIKSIVT